MLLLHIVHLLWLLVYSVFSSRKHDGFSDFPDLLQFPNLCLGPLLGLQQSGLLHIILHLVPDTFKNRTYLCLDSRACCLVVAGVDIVLLVYQLCASTAVPVCVADRCWNPSAVRLDTYTVSG